MTLQAQHKWWLTYSKFQKSREETWQSVIYKNLKAQIQPSIEILKENGIQSAISNLDRTVQLEPIARTVKNIYIDAGSVFGAKTYQMVKKQVFAKSMIVEVVGGYNEDMFQKIDREIIMEEKRLMPIGFNEQMVNDIINYYNLYLLSKAVIPITETTKQFILEKLIQGQQEGLSIQQIVNLLTDTDITRNRARLIARTETAKSANWAAVWGARKTNYATDKLWISARDQRTRRVPRDLFGHLQMNGTKVPIDEPFLIPKKEGGYEMLNQPGDVNGSAADTIRCRCVVGFSIKRDSVGRPLRTNQHI